MIASVNPNAGFDSGIWAHWLLVACFCVIAACGLWLSWQWREERMVRQQKAKLNRRMMRIVHHFFPAEQVSGKRGTQLRSPRKGK
ncbi:MAG: hypothetical protein ACFB16_06730 [Phormidesmis sp.]